MPLSPPAPREHLHTRQVECRGYLREDGLWEVEGHMTDVKTYSFPNDERGEVGAGTPVHDMWIRIAVDDDLMITAIEAVTDASPFRVCPTITPNFQRLVGLSIRPGFIPRIKELLGGVEGCTHLVELMGPIATTAFQTISSTRGREKRERARKAANGGAAPPEKKRRPRLLDTCHAFASDGEVVKRFWPEFYTGQ
jgi:Protein of unknown function (DUF2889)